MPPVSTPAADGIVAGVDALSVSDDLRATVFGDVGHLLPQLFHFLVFVLPRALRAAPVPLYENAARPDSRGGPTPLGMRVDVSCAARFGN